MQARLSTDGRPFISARTKCFEEARAWAGAFGAGIRAGEAVDELATEEAEVVE